MKGISIKEEKFKILINLIKKDKKFLASAITMPYKKKIIKHIIIKDRLSLFAKSINLILKKKTKLYGYNTDVYGAIESIKKTNKKNIMIFGFGGAGEAIFRTLKKIYSKSNFLIISSQKKINIKLDNNIKIKKNINEEDIKIIDLFINCSPLGSDLNEKFINKSPISFNLLKKLKKKAFVFDIVYKPNKTILSKYCNKLKIKYLNGLKMNTVQAEKALEIIYKELKKQNLN